jgi:alpha-D-xyloside xylohydrolase
VYEGNSWNTIKAGILPEIVLAKCGSVIPRIALAESTKFMDWSKIDLVIFKTENKNFNGYLMLQNSALYEVEVFFDGKNWKEKKSPET